MNLKEAIRKIMVKYDNGNTLFVSSDGLISRELYSQKQQGVFPMVGSMGLCSAIGVGLYKSTNKRIVVIDGDGAFLMSAGTQVLLEQLTTSRLVHIVLDNGCYGTTGNQKCIRIPKEISKRLIVMKIDKYGSYKPPRIKNLVKIKKEFMRCCK